MSAETIEWLNANTLIGFTATDGNAWHWDGIAKNQYPAAIPVDDIRTKLFNWRAEFLTPMFNVHEGAGDDIPMHLVDDTEMKALVRIDGDKVVRFNYVTDSYAIHQFDDWLIDNVAALVDTSAGELSFGSAGLLRGGAVAWVQIRPPELVTIGDDTFLKFILAVTSHNSTIATTYKVVYQRVVCDNTLDMAMQEQSKGVFRVKHTSGSGLLVAEARQALDIMFKGMETFDAEIEQLMNTPLTTNQFAGAIKNHWEPVEEEQDGDGKVINQRSINNWDRRWDEMMNLWNDDPRVGKYKGTMWGGLMAYNTHSQWAMAERDTNDRDTADVKTAQLNGMVTGNLGDSDRDWMASMKLAMA